MLFQCAHIDYKYTACGLYTYSHIPDCRLSSVPRLWNGFQSRENLITDRKQNAHLMWQGLKSLESLVCNIITFIPNTKIMYVKWCNWPFFCTLAFINIYMYLKIKNMWVCVYIYIKKPAQFCKHECYFFFMKDFV